MSNAKQNQVMERDRTLAEARSLIKSMGDDAPLTRRHVAALLGKAHNTLADWAWRGVGPRYAMIGGRPAYLWKDVRGYVESRTVNTADQPAKGGGQ